jgi:hypothetical protein
VLRWKEMRDASFEESEGQRKERGDELGLDERERSGRHKDGVCCISISSNIRTDLRRVQREELEKGETGSSPSNRYPSCHLASAARQTSARRLIDGLEEG